MKLVEKKMLRLLSKILFIALFSGVVFFIKTIPAYAVTPSVVNSSVDTFGTTTNAWVDIGGASSSNSFVVFVHYRNYSESVDSVYTGDYDYFSTGCFSRGNEYTTEVWYLLEPSGAMDDIYVDWTGSVEDAVVGVIEVENVDLTLGANRDDNCSGTSSFLTSYSVSTSPESDDLVLSGATVYSPGSNLSSTASGYSELYDQTQGNVRFSALSADGSNSSILWTNTASWPWSLVSIALPGTSDGGGGGEVIAPITLTDSAYLAAGTTDYDYLSIYPDGENRFLVAVAHYRSTIDSLNEVAYDGVTMNSTCVERNNEYTTEIWYMENPSINGEFVDFYWSNSVEDVVIQAIAFENVDQITSIADYVCDNNGPFPWDVSIESSIQSSSTDQIVFGAATSYSGNFNTLYVDGSATELYADYVGNVSYASAFLNAVDGTTNIGWTGGTAWPSSMIALLLNPVTDGGGGGGSPAVTWNEEISTNEDPSFTISGTATASLGVYDIYAGVCYSGNCYSYSDTFYGEPDDGYFDETSENFSISFTDLPYGYLDFTIFVEDEFGEVTEYNYTNVEINEDLTGPSLSFSTFPSSYSSNDLQFVGTATDSETTVSTVIISYGYNGGSFIDSFEADASDGVFNELSEAFSYTISNVEDGEYEVTVTSYNAHGAESSYSAVVTVVDDESDPVISIGNLGQTPSTNTTPTFTGSVSDETPIVTLQYRVYDSTVGYDEVEFTDITVNDGTLDESAEDFSFTTPSLTDGAKAIVIKAIDTVGNEFDNVVDRIVIDAEDTSAPIIRVQDVVPDPITDPSPVIAGRVDDDSDELTSNIAALYFKVDSGSWQDLPVRDGVIGDETSEEFNIELMNLSLGSHTVTVRAVDDAGNDTDSDLNVTKSFEVIEQTENLSPANINTIVSFDSRTYYDSINNDLIWGNGQLRLSEVVDPVVTELISNDNEQFGSRYENGQGVYDVVPSASGGYWFSLSGSEFAYVSPDNVVTTFNAQTWGGSLSSELEEVYINGEYHLWLTTDNRLLGLNFGDSIVNGAESYIAYDPPGSIGTNIFEIDTRNEDSYGIYFSNSNTLYYIDDPTFSNTVIYDMSTLSPRTAPTYFTNDIVELFLDEERDHLWIGAYNDGVQRLSDFNTPTDLGDDEVLNYTNEINVFSIGVDKDGKPFFAGNSGLRIVLDDNDTDNDTTDDTIYTLVDQYDLNLGVASYVKYFAGDSIVPSTFYIANRTGTFYYFSSNGTYDDPIDDQLIEMNFVGDHYPAEIRRFYMPDQTTVYFSVVHKGAFKADLNKQFAETGYTQTVTDSQIDQYLDADYFTLEGVDRVDTSNAEVIYEVSNDGGVTWYEVEIGDVIDFIDNDYRISLRITMNRGSTPVLTSVELSYAAYANEDPDERTLTSYGFTNLPSSVNSGSSFSFEVNLLDEVSKVLKISDTATITLKRSSDNQVIGSFPVSSLSFVDGVATINSVSANVIGDHYLVVTNGSISTNSNAISFIGNDSSGSEESSSSDNNDSNNSEESSSNEEEELVEEDTEVILYQTSSPSPSPDLDDEQDDENKEEINLPEIIRFWISSVSKENGVEKIKIEWDVIGADWIEISGIGSNLPATGERIIEINKDTVIQLVARNGDGASYVKKEYKFQPPLLNRLFPNLSPEDGTGKVAYEILGIATMVIKDTIAPISAVAATVTIPTVAAIGVLSQAAQASQGFSLKSILSSLRALGVLPKKKAKGVVYDSKTKKTVPFALLTFKESNSNSESNILETVVTDVHGVFQSISLPSSEYTVTVSHQDYTFPTKRNRPAYFTMLEYYKGEEFTIKSNQDKQTLFVPIDSKVMISDKSSIKNSLNILLSYFALKNITHLMFAVSVVFTILSPSLVNFLVIGLYLLIYGYRLFIYLFSTKVTGKVMDESGNPIEDVIVRLSDQTGAVFTVVTTNKNGSFKAYLKKEKYQIAAYKFGFFWNTGMNLVEVDTSSASQSIEIKMSRANFYKDMFNQ